MAGEAGEFFHEEQRFTQAWIWLVVLALAGLSWWALVTQILLDEPFGDDPASEWVLWIGWLAFGIGFPVFIGSLKLTVSVSYERVLIRFRPLVRRPIPLSEICHSAERTYRPLREYGGWGIRGWGAKRAYNVSGNRASRSSSRTEQDRGRFAAPGGAGARN